jgi:hypothetical protein
MALLRHAAKEEESENKLARNVQKAVEIRLEARYRDATRNAALRLCVYAIRFEAA